MNNQPLTFIHLSDIHFQKRSGGVLDLDVDLRNQLEIDVVQMKNIIGEISGLLISGDIAYSGHEKEYIKAMDWLHNVCDHLSCKDQNVWVTPGNHDVQRDVINASKVLKNQYERFRERGVDELDSELRDAFSDPTYSKILFEPIENYIKFASKFSCDISTEKPYWKQDIPLNDGSKLRLCGLNSTIVSDCNDNNEANKLILGSHQTLLPVEEGVSYFILCHHPCDWLRDGDTASSALNQRARVQLFGHKHSQTIERIENIDKSVTLKIVAGAVHPERDGHKWLPRYNILSVAVEGKDISRMLKVIVYPRLWIKENLDFGPDPTIGDSISREFSIPLPHWRNPTLSNVQHAIELTRSSQQNAIDQSSNVNDVIEHSSGELAMDSSRRLAFRFLTLQYHEIMEIANRLQLLLDEDDGLHDFELFKRIFLRAKQQNMLDDLSTAVEEKHHADNPEANPNFNKEV